MELLKNNIPFLIIVVFLLWRVFRYINGRKALARTLATNNYQLVDVRSGAEYATFSIPGSINVPVDKIVAGLPLIDKKRSIIVYCASGGRSAMARLHLLRLGYKDVINGGGVSTVANLLQKETK
ncbi:rhodanese-like domain-containing protein [Flavobacterium alkalisoli]|uniref:rhodanese-like domain-containing protein n=1 Tax=Flavobacterium alkalisoli TaxID=2602769 RepID=UPI003A8E538C